MKLYIKVEDGEPVEHPIFEENLKQVLMVSTITEAALEQHGYAVFEQTPVAINEVPIGEPTYQMGEDGIVRQVNNVREMTQEEKLEHWIRRPRNHLLATSDWTQVPDVPMSDTLRKKWKDIRQELRNMTETYADIEHPDEVQWPQAPTA